MPITLADAAVNTQDDVDFAVIDQLRRYSLLLDMLTFDDCVNPAGGGATLTYGYTRLTTARTGAFRAVNSEYTPGQAARERYTVDLKALGGSFEVDRVLANLGPAATNEVAFQMDQLTKGVRGTFQDAVINGDTNDVAEGFDGLDVALAGSSTEMSAGAVVDWSAITDEAGAHEAIDLLDELLSLLNEAPSAILTNTRGAARVRALARRAGYYDRSRDDFGRNVESYGGVPIIDLGDKPDGSGPIIPIETRDPDGDATTTDGLTDIYVVRMGLDGFHAVSVNGPLVQTWLPDFTSAGAVKTGEAEMGPVATVLKNTKAAGVLRNVKVNV